MASALSHTHAAKHSYRRGGKATWTEYTQMMGGAFAGRLFNVGIGGMLIELYRSDPNTAPPTVRKFLLVLDTLRMDDTGRGNRTQDGRYPISWVSAPGRGRTFYDSLGHRRSVDWNAAIRENYWPASSTCSATCPPTSRRQKE